MKRRRRPAHLGNVTAHRRKLQRTYAAKIVANARRAAQRGDCGKAAYYARVASGEVGVRTHARLQAAVERCYLRTRGGFV